MQTIWHLISFSWNLSSHFRLLRCHCLVQWTWYQVLHLSGHLPFWGILSWREWIGTCCEDCPSHTHTVTDTGKRESSREARSLYWSTNAGNYAPPSHMSPNWETGRLGAAYQLLGLWVPAWAVCCTKRLPKLLAAQDSSTFYPEHQLTWTEWGLWRILLYLDTQRLHLLLPKARAVVSRRGIVRGEVEMRCTNKPKMASLYWPLGYVFAAGWDKLTQKSTDAQLKFLHIQLFQKK